MKQRKIYLVILLIVAMFSLTACLDDDYEDSYSDSYENDYGDDGGSNTSASTTTYSSSAQLYDANDTWAIYWYLCGSDLESEDGSATADLEEMFEVTLPDNVQIIIETGGANEWQNDFVTDNAQCRFLYSGNELEQLEVLPKSNMGDGKTFKSFLTFCNTEYPADHQIVILWNHGGGSTSGIAFDELYDFDSLSLSEMHDAFEAAFSLSTENPPIEMVGFDACLMATVDTAYSLRDVSKYLVASEETEPGGGWDYTGFLETFNKQPSLNGGVLGKAICDTYVRHCNSNGEGDEITLSVVDLTQTDSLFAAYHNIGIEALSTACSDSSFVSKLGRAADSAEAYGSNNKNEGYTNLVDLGDFISNVSDQLPETSTLIQNALSECVVYKVNGPYRTQASGLSCFYPYDMDMISYSSFEEISFSPAHNHLYEYMINGSMTDAGFSYILEMQYEEVPEFEVTYTPEFDDFDSVDDVPEVPTLQDSDFEDHPVSIDDGYATLNLGSSNADLLAGVYFYLAYYSDDDDILLFLGRDNDLEQDWDNGVFRDNFRGVWGALDGNLVYMELTYEGEDYNLYSVPILLNGSECYLRVSYDYNSDSYEILGAKQGLNDNGMSDKNLTKLKSGDTITTIYYAMSLSDDDDDLKEIEMDTFAIGSKPSFSETYLGDGSYVLMFEMVDTRNNSAFSDLVFITVEDEEIYFETE